MYTVGQLAKLTGLTVRALHHYDALGLLCPSQRSDAGYRLYTRDDVAKLFRIQALQTAGLSLAQIGDAMALNGAALPDLIAQQLATLDEQIEQATALRSRLSALQEVLNAGDEPEPAEWVEAIDLITQYGKVCSNDELKRLIEHRQSDADEWRQFIESLRAALTDKMVPSSDAAYALLRQWSQLLLRRVGGDVGLAMKLKQAYAQDQQLQARLAMQGHITPEMMSYLGAVMWHVHRSLWSRHLEPADFERVRFDGKWQNLLLPAIAAIINSNGDEDRVLLAQNQWHELLAEFCAHEETLITKVELALAQDSELQSLWLIDERVRSVLAIKQQSRH